MKKVNFLHFADIDGNKTNVAYAPGYYWSEHLEDLVVKCEITNGKMILSVVPFQWMTGQEIKDINFELKKGINDSWEFLTFYPTDQLVEDSLDLFADQNSKMHKIITSPQNLQNILDVVDKLETINKK